MATQADISLAMVQQLRLLDPSVSAEVGTPERKIIDTVAQVIAEQQVNLNQLDGAFDLDSKFGADLDNFLSIFGFGRQTGAFASGFVTFSRPTASSYVVPIPSHTQVVAPSISLEGASTSTSVPFETTAYGEIPAGDLSVVIPVRSLSIGTVGNVAAAAITTFFGTPIPGITTVNNEIPTAGGTDAETDPAFKTRFRNTVFRNLAGTQDQYLALAVSTQNTTKASVVGPQSRYQEYVQIPDVDDATNDPTTGYGGNGAAGEYTTALSTIPYSKHIWDTVPYYVTNSDTSGAATFFRRDVDFLLNTTIPLRDKGDAYRGRFDSSGLDVRTDAATTYQPNLTFYNIYTGSDDTVTAIRTADVLLFEHSYMSSASRNDFDRQILNCVDVFVNGSNPTLADAICAKPSSGYATANTFSTNPSSRLYIENFRRVGEANRRPVVGNIFIPLYWTPTTDLPDTIVTSTGSYNKGEHYWALEDVSDIGRSVRARTGIEWNTTVLAQTSADNAGGPYTGTTIIADTDTSLEVTGYTYDRNITDLQVSLDGNKQVTTDVLAHQSETRYFKLDITVMYNQGVTASTVNTNIAGAVSDFFAGQYFGATIQLSDILQAIHSVGGVDNVRWSRDLLANRTPDYDSLGDYRHRIVECDATGNPLLNFLVDRKTYGTAATAEVQVGYFTGTPTGGTIGLVQNSIVGSIAYNANSAAVQTALRTITGDASLTVSGSGTPLSPFLITFSTNSYQNIIRAADSVPGVSIQNKLTGSTSTGNSNTVVYDYDFFLRDNELPALPSAALSTDSVVGLTIRPRAQATWNQL